MDILLKGGMVLEDKFGVFGLITSTHLGILVGWENGNVECFGDAVLIKDIYESYKITNVYKITREDQILGKDLKKDSLELIWTKPIVISNTEELIEWAEKNNIDVSNVLIAAN